MINGTSDNIPFVRFLVPAGAGILLASALPIGWTYWAVCFGVAWLSACFIRRGAMGGLYTWITVMLFFGSVTSLTDPSVRENPSAVGRITAEVVLTEEPAPAGRWNRAAGYAAAFRDGGDELGEWATGNFGVQIFTDTSQAVLPGSRMIVTGWYYPFTEADGSYGRLMLRRGIAGRIFVPAGGVVIDTGNTGLDRRSRLSVPERLHNGAVRKFAELNTSGRHGVSSAMVTGDKRFIPAEVSRNYRDGGGAHLLAVSGLHVGIVFVLVNLLLWFVPSFRRGHIIKNILSVGMVWLFALAAGLSPSVLRAALMFSFAQFALARGTIKDAVNILAASAFVMLACNPWYAADPGFVLSYAAVLAILLFFAPVFSLVRTGIRALDAVLSVLIVGIAATLATAPFISYWFGAVPVAGIIVNPVVIFTAHIIVGVGVMWLVWPFGFGAGGFSRILSIAEGVQNGVTEWCAGQQWGVLEVRLSLAMAVAAYGLIVLSAVWLRKYTDARAKALSLPA